MPRQSAARRVLASPSKCGECGHPHLYHKIGGSTGCVVDIPVGNAGKGKRFGTNSLRCGCTAMVKGGDT